MKDMIQVTRLLLKLRCFNPNGFEKTEVHGQKINKILHMTVAIGEVKALHYLLIFSTTLDGFYFANRVLAAVFFSS